MSGKQTKLVLLLALTLIATVMATGCTNNKNTANVTSTNSKYAAKVNGTYITMEQFESAANNIISFYETSARKLTDGEKQALYKETLSQLTDNLLISQEAQKRHISAPEEQVTKYINNLKKSLGDAKFKSSIKEWGYTEEGYKNKIKDKFVYQELKDAVTKGIKDPLAKEQAYDKYMANVKSSASIETYVNFKQ